MDKVKKASLLYIEKQLVLAMSSGIKGNVVCAIQGLRYFKDVNISRKVRIFLVLSNIVGHSVNSKILKSLLYIRRLFKK